MIACHRLVSPASFPQYEICGLYSSSRQKYSSLDTLAIFADDLPMSNEPADIIWSDAVNELAQQGRRNWPGRPGSCRTAKVCSA